MTTAYFKVIKMRMEINEKKKAIDELMPAAVKELRTEGFNYDKISKLLEIGKVTAIKYGDERTVSKVEQ